MFQCMKQGWNVNHKPILKDVLNLLAHILLIMKSDIRTLEYTSEANGCFAIHLLPLCIFFLLCCLSKLLNVFVQIAKFICPDCWMYLSKLQNVFVQITNSATTSFGYVSFCSDLFGWEMFVLNFQFLLMQFLNAMQFLRQSFLSALIRTLSGNHHALIL